MTSMHTDNVVDAFTLGHLNAWLDSYVRDTDARDDVRRAMLAVVTDDPSVIDLGWPRVYEIADGLTVENDVETRLMLER
jgi:hypothetical protein